MAITKEQFLEISKWYIEHRGYGSAVTLSNVKSHAAQEETEKRIAKMAISAATRLVGASVAPSFEIALTKLSEETIESLNKAWAGFANRFDVSGFSIHAGRPVAIGVKIITDADNPNTVEAFFDQAVGDFVVISEEHRVKKLSTLTKNEIPFDITVCFVVPDRISSSDYLCFANMEIQISGYGAQAGQIWIVDLKENKVHSGNPVEWAVDGFWNRTLPRWFGKKEVVAPQQPQIKPGLPSAVQLQKCLNYFSSTELR